MLYSEALDILQISGHPVAAGETRGTKPPESWVGASPKAKEVESSGQDSKATSGATRSAFSSTPEEKGTGKAGGDKARSPVKSQDPDKLKAGQVSDQASLEEREVEGSAELGEEAEEEELLEIDPVVPDMKEETRARERRSDRSSHGRGKSSKEKERARAPRHRERDHRGERGGRKAEEPKRRRSPKVKQETESRRVRAREKSVSRPRGLRLRPTSPSYPPPGERQKKQSAEWWHYSSENTIFAH